MTSTCLELLILLAQLYSLASIRMVFRKLLFLLLLPNVVCHAQLIDCIQLQAERDGARFTFNNSIVFFDNGKAKFNDLFKAIGEAKSTIHMEYFNFRDDSIANMLFDSLAVKVKDGVKVRLLYDSFGNSSNDMPIRKKRLKEIRETGVEIYEFDPIKFPWINHVMPRDHRKIVIVDGKSAYSGGMNVADYYINGKPEFGSWHDLHYRIEGDAVGEYQAIFLRAWEKVTGQKVSGADLYPGESLPENAIPRLKKDTTSTFGSKIIAVINREPHTSPKIIRKTFINCITNAKERILLINPYFTLSHSIVKAIKRAIRRGVDVQIMVSEKSDIPITPRIVDYQTRRLTEAGAKVYYYQDGFHHSKIMMIDGQWSYVGSANLDSRSLRCDYEVNALINDSLATRQLETLFVRERDNHCKLMDDSYWRSFSGFRKFQAWLFHFLLTRWV